MSDQFRKASDIINVFFSEIGVDNSKLELSNAFVRDWKLMVGDKISSHSKILDVDKGILTIEVDHPGWSQQVLYQKKQILSRLERSFPDLKIANINIRVRSECITPYKKSETVVGEGIPRVAEKQEDVEVKKEFDDDLRKVLENLKTSIKKGKPV